jgi:ribosomal protein S18 acetylase RimI-like enzyme
MTDVIVRAARPDDQGFLWEMLYAAIFVPPGDDPPPRTILGDPHLAHYVDAMGSRPGDSAWIAESPEGTRVGALWLRRLPNGDPGYGFVDADTPELGIAVTAAHRGAGIGTLLMTTALAATGRCSLSVDRRNPAARLYERLGFVVVSEGGSSVTMLYEP